MTWKERRNVRVLLTVIAVLAAALLIVFGMRFREGREEALAGADSSPEGAAFSLSDPAACAGLTYFNGSFTLTFAMNEEGNWYWADAPDFPLEDKTVREIVETLSALKFQQVLPAEEEKEAYGLDSPSARLTATTGGGDTQELVFGKTTTDGDSYYMMMNGNESTVYIVADTLVKLMQMPVYDMCDLPELPDFSEANLRAITIQGPAPEPEESTEEDGVEPVEIQEPQRPTVSLNARRSGGEDQPALWFDGSDNVTASALLQDLLHDLKTMAPAKCVDYHPSDEAAEICGFDSPDAILKVEYTENGAEQTYTLRVGARMPDESGRYVQLEEDSTIYAMPTDSVDALMTISVAGMRGTAQNGGEE